MKLIPVACLAAGLFITGSSLTLAQEMGAPQTGAPQTGAPETQALDYSPPDQATYSSIDQKCRFFDKIVFKIKDGSYAGRLFDVKIAEKSITDITDLNKEVQQACTRNPYSKNYDTSGSYHLPCSEVKKGNYEITFVDFAVACATQKY